MFTVVRSRMICLHTKKTYVNLLFSSLPNNFEVIPKKLTFVKNVRFKTIYKPGIQLESPPGSRYIPLSPIETAEESMLSELKEKSSMTHEEWENFKSIVLDRESFISEENFSSIVMNVLLSSNQLDLGHSFLKYVENSNVKPNFLTYLKYISLCSRNHRVVDQEIILEILNKVRKPLDLSPVLDTKRAEYIIQGFCATDKWRESFQYLEKLVNCKPSEKICIALACAAIRNDDEKLAWEILTKWMNAYESVNESIIEEFLIVALKMQKINSRESDKLIEKLFQYMQMRDVIITVDVVKLIEQYFTCHRLKWNITYTKVSRTGVCGICHYDLKLFQLGSCEFEELRESFLQQSVMKSDLYINTSKKEFANYMKFIDFHKPFHIIVDGLNAAHSYPGHKSKKNLSFHLMKIVKRLSGSYRRVLVLGRNHMRNWPGINRISERAKLFFTDNISQDDPFVIYAALASGPHTLFLSDDLMRDHISRLDDPKLIHMFKRWQLSHQMFVQSNDDYNIKYIEPLRHSITVQGDMECGWHIPFDDKIILDPYEELNNWLCIHKVI